MAALLAELRAELIGRTTAGAGYFQTPAALLAKHRISGVLVLAPGTLHAILISQVDGGRDGGTKLAPRHHWVNNGFGDENHKTARV